MRPALIAVAACAVLAGCCCRSACCPPPSAPAALPPAVAPPATPAPVDVAEPAPSPAKPEPARGGFRTLGVGPVAPAPSAASAGAPPGPPVRLRGLVLAAKATSGTVSGSAQVTLENRTSMTLDLYVDGAYGCRALKSLMCTTQVTPGDLSLEARGPNGESASASTSVGVGASITWTVSEE